MFMKLRQLVVNLEYRVLSDLSTFILFSVDLDRRLFKIEENAVSIFVQKFNFPDVDHHWMKSSSFKNEISFI